MIQTFTFWTIGVVCIVYALFNIAMVLNSDVGFIKTVIDSMVVLIKCFILFIFLSFIFICMLAIFRPTEKRAHQSRFIVSTEAAAAELS